MICLDAVSQLAPEYEVKKMLMIRRSFDERHGKSRALRCGGPAIISFYFVRGTGNPTSEKQGNLILLGSTLTYACSLFLSVSLLCYIDPKYRVATHCLECLTLL